MDFKPVDKSLTDPATKMFSLSEKDKVKLRQACADVESLFLTQLIKTMKDSIPESGLLPKQAGSKLYESMFDERLAGFLSRGRGMGLGKELYEQMLPRDARTSVNNDELKPLDTIGLAKTDEDKTNE